jgi:NADH-quinone oxidoreductase subunit I
VEDGIPDIDSESAGHESPNPSGTLIAIGAMNSRELTFKERLYIVEVFKGLWLTSRHFFGNMKKHLARQLGLNRLEKGAVTFQYPEERRPFSPRYRSRHRLTMREDGSPRCVACMMCETACPARCIYIVAGEHPDPNIEKFPVRFDIDLGVCVFCGFCVEACPEDAIRMDTGIVEIAAYSRKEMIYHIEDLLQ